MIIKLDNETPTDILYQISLLHEATLSAGVLAKLGVVFLCELYRYISCSKYSTVYVFMNDNVVSGFISCTVNSRKLYNSFLFNNLILIIKSIPKFIKPSIFKRSLSLIKYMMSRSKSTAVVPSAELLSISVINTAHRKGIGSQLFEYAVKYFKDNNVNHFKVTAADTQVTAHKFYIEMGGCPVQVIDLGQLKSTIYTFNV